VTVLPMGLCLSHWVVHVHILKEVGVRAGAPVHELVVERVRSRLATPSRAYILMTNLPLRVCLLEVLLLLHNEVVLVLAIANFVSVNGVPERLEVLFVGITTVLLGSGLAAADIGLAFVLGEAVSALTVGLRLVNVR